MTHAIGVMNGNWRHRWDDRDLAPTGTTIPIREQLENQLKLAEQKLKNGADFPEMVASAELRIAELKTKLALLDRIESILARNL